MAKPTWLKPKSSRARRMRLPSLDSSIFLSGTLSTPLYAICLAPPWSLHNFSHRFIGYFQYYFSHFRVSFEYGKTVTVIDRNESGGPTRVAKSDPGRVHQGLEIFRTRIRRLNQRYQTALVPSAFKGMREGGKRPNFESYETSDDGT